MPSLMLEIIHRLRGHEEIKETAVSEKSHTLGHHSVGNKILDPWTEHFQKY